MARDGSGKVAIKLSAARRERSRSATTTFAPWDAYNRTISTPIPPTAPVITTVFPLMLLSKPESSSIDAMFECHEVAVNVFLFG
jgi:hypothetical protein